MEVKETLDTSKVGFDSFEVELGFDPDDIEYGGIVAHNTYLNGNLGLGIQAPSSKLQILGDGTGTGVQLLTQNNTQTNFGLAVLDNGNVGIGTTAPTGVFQVGSSATAPVLFASSLTGNVGIGTTNPGTALDVVGTGRFSSTLTASNGLTVSAGQLLVPDGTDAIPGIGFTDANTGFRGRVNAGIVAIIDGVQHAYFGNSTLTLATTDALSWASGQYTDSATDLSIFRDAANVLAQRRSTNAQEFRIYNSDSTSDEFASLGFINNSNVFTIETEQVGGGTVLPIALMGGNVGIGFTSPAALLDVMGTALLRGSSTTTGLAVTAAGNVGVGTTSPSAPFEVKAAGTGAIAKFTSDNSTGCTLADGGTITCSSDLSLKKNITGLSYGLSDLLKLNPVEFNWKIDEDGSLKNLGFIAQEVETVLPKLVITGEAGLKELNTIGLVPLLTKSIQQIEGRLKGLEEKIASDSVQFIASSSASLNLTPPDILLATGSAKLKDLQVFSEATVSGMLAAYELKVSDSLKSLGLTTLAKTNVAGDLIIDGTLSITGNSISSLETLKLQGGKVTIDNQGNLTVQKLIVSSKTLGTAVIPAKQQQLLVKGQITSSSKVFLTPERPAVLGVSKDPLTQTFTILLEKVQDKELKVDWWIVDSEE
ncbi:tail fiber domain-containing protein [Candidatus Daviesbacteria bacterium]|nr:tail fiber domain-containing protein [Candidatus Daviesbacteria bacterium]